MEVMDRIASLEQRVQMQEDEIQLLKSALADVVRRLNISEEQNAMTNRRGPTKGTLLSGIPPRLIYITSPRSTVRRTNSNETMGTLTRKDSADSKSNRTRTGSSGSNSSGKRAITVQIYLARPSKRTGTAEAPKSNAAAVSGRSSAPPTAPDSKSASDKSVKSNGVRKTPTFALPLRKSVSQSSYTPYSPLDTQSYKSPIKSPSQYFQIWYVKMYLKGRPITMYMPKDLVDTYCLEAKSDLPNKKLKLDWVYGYRGRDCRCNLYLLPTGETVYFIASVVVLYNVDEQLQRHYTGHTDDIKCLAVHPDKITIATGQVAGTSSEGKQLAPHVRVWDSVSLNTLHVLGTGFFDRALVCLAFSKSNGGNTLCVVDDSNDHVLSVWDWQREERLADVKCSNEAVFAADFHPTDTNIIVTCGKSHLYFWTLERGTLAKKQGLFEKQEKPKFFLCVTFSENGDTITGDSSGNILVWGKGTNRISHTIQGAHEGSIFALCMLRNSTLVSGGKDRKLISWDGSYQQIQSVEPSVKSNTDNTKKTTLTPTVAGSLPLVPELFGPVRTVAEGKGESVLIGTTRNYVLQGSLYGEFTPITQGHTDELWGLAVHPWKPHFLTCGHDKHVSLWDTSTHQPVWTKTMEDAAQSAGFHPSGAVVAIGMQTGRWLVLETDSKDLVTVHTDGNEQLSVISFAPDGNFLAIGSHDNYIYIYAVGESGRKYSRVGKC
ncbi:unnamed protein product, partial [Coregonus sp. 'balchen']